MLEGVFQRPHREEKKWRRGWDSNPWCREAHTISSRAYSSALAPLRVKKPVGRSIAFCGGGESGIRTRDEITPILVFETSAFIRSAISPDRKIIAQGYSQLDTDVDQPFVRDDLCDPKLGRFLWASRRNEIALNLLSPFWLDWCPAAA